MREGFSWGMTTGLGQGLPRRWRWGPALPLSGWNTLSPPIPSNRAAVLVQSLSPKPAVPLLLLQNPQWLSPPTPWGLQNPHPHPREGEWPWSKAAAACFLPPLCLRVGVDAVKVDPAHWVPGGNEEWCLRLHPFPGSH